MKITIVAALCHALANIQTPVCHEEVAYTTDEGSMQMCMFAQAAIAEWKEAHPVFKDEAWTVERYKCVFGNYLPKDAI